MTDRKRATLPEDYQFGDAADYGAGVSFSACWTPTPAHVHDYAIYDPSWRAYRCRCGLIGAPDVDTRAHGRVKRIMK